MGSGPPLIALVGPTAVGKTSLAIELAEMLGAEIVSADSRLFYRGMDIGTAKPTLTERQRVPHHLVDIADPDQTLSLAVFQKLAQQAVAEIRERGHLPLLVGGTGQYLRAVAEGWLPPAVQPDPRLRDELTRLKDAKGAEWLHSRLALLDPEAAASIDLRNSRRTVRALEVILSTGRRFSDQRSRAAPGHRLLSVGLLLPRPVLYARIDARIEAMFEAGLLDEVRALLQRGHSPDLPAFSAIGYRESIRVLKGDWDIEQAKREMRRTTRAYVRRQANWFKATDPDIHWFDAGQPRLVEEVAAAIREFLHETASAR